MLINCGDKQIFDYVRNFLFDYFNSSDLTIYFIKMDIIKLKKKIQLTLLKMKIKLLKQLRKKKQTKYYIINQKNIDINTSCNF